MALAAAIGFFAGCFFRTTLLYLVRPGRRGLGAVEGVPASHSFLMVTVPCDLHLPLGVGAGSAKVVPARGKTTSPSSSAHERIRAICIL